MCGLAGFWAGGRESGPLAAIATAMADAIAHRGPDDAGTWVDAEAGIALAHRRLSILDLSSAGHQPMASARGRWVVVYNGEIYNHLQLRRELGVGEGTWRGHSDTETLLRCLEAWGPDATLRRCIGMFAFAAWDKLEGELWLARDRAGEKPLYYGSQAETFLFGSELKALAAHPDFKGEIDRGALALMVRHNYVPSPHSIYGGIMKLPQGSYVRVRHGRPSQPVRYWSLSDIAASAANDPFRGSDAEAVEALESQLSAAVGRQMISDVPLGALLSGGIDSTLVVALMQAQSRIPVRTFTIGFGDEAYDEAAHARAVAAHIGTEHNELRLDPKDVLDIVPLIPDIYDEPFADSSQLPTFLVARMARSSVKVALSGDGGDEFFGGYNRYFLGPTAWRRVSWMPHPMRRALGAVLAGVPAAVANRALSGLPIVLPGDKLNKLGQRLGQVRSLDDMYASLVSEWNETPCFVLGADGLPETLLQQRGSWPSPGDPASRLMAMDALTYLPDDILVKVDRAAMAVSLETRAPFLDRDVMEFAWRLPVGMKIRNGRGKWILRELLDRHVPRTLVDRPKMGFGIPLDQWLRGPLRDWAESLLDEKRLAGEGFFDPKPIRKAWRRHQEGAPYGYRLWSILMFQAWLAARGDGR
jgi:asparagine synthase (glutamine-hydrolysing)